MWASNRDNLITTPSSAMLAPTNSFDLVLSNSQGCTSWVTENNITIGNWSGCRLVDAGNSVLQTANGSNVLQNFDHRIDTAIPTMKFLVSHKEKMEGVSLLGRARMTHPLGNSHASVT
jgi:hypothetical protein